MEGVNHRPWPITDYTLVTNSYQRMSLQINNRQTGECSKYKIITLFLLPDVTNTYHLCELDTPTSNVTISYSYFQCNNFLTICGNKIHQLLITMITYFPCICLSSFCTLPPSILILLNNTF